MFSLSNRWSKRKHQVFRIAFDILILKSVLETHIYIFEMISSFDLTYCS